MVMVWKFWPKNLGAHHFPDPIGNFGALWWPFWIFEVLEEGMMESKKIFSKRYSGGPNNIGFDLFPDPVGHFELSRL